MEEPTKITVDAEVYIDQQIDFDEDEGVVVRTVIFSADDEDVAHASFSVEELVEEQIGFARLANDYQFLYSLSHEFTRLSDQLREVAERMEGSLNAVGDLFDLDRGDLE